MKQTSLSLLIMFLAAPAWAADSVTAEPLAPLPGGDIMITGEGPAEPIPQAQPQQVPVAQPETTTPATASTICQSVTTVGQISGPNYVEGVDAYGRPVAPADLSQSSAIDVPERIDIPVAIDVAQSMNLAPATEMSVVPGTVTVFKDGRVLYNGQDVSGPVSAYCNQLKTELNVTIQ